MSSKTYSVSQPSDRCICNLLNINQPVPFICATHFVTMAKTKAEEALNLSLDDIIKRNRENVKPAKAKPSAKDDGGRKPRGSLRGKGRSASDARIAVVKVVKTKRAAPSRGRPSGDYINYEDALDVVSCPPARVFARNAENI